MPEAFVDDIDCPYETPRDKPFTWIRAQGLGGRMIVPGHGRQYYRLGPDDFAPRDGLSPRWPFAPADLNPWYSLVEQRLALFGARDGVSFAPDSDIAHLLRPTTSEAVLRRTIQSRWPKAAAILGRYAPPLASVEAANATGKLWCRTGALVQRVEADGDGRVRGVAWHDRQARCSAAARAPLVFLCASALESTRILMVSQSGTGNGLARSSDALGRHLMDHIMVKVEGVGHKLAGEHVSIDDGRCLYLPRFDLRDGGEDPGRGYGVQVYQGFAGGDQSYFTAVAFCEMAPRAENRVSLDASRKDAWGAPALRIECSHNDAERALAQKMTTALRDLTKLVDAKVARLDEAPDMPGTAIHECGTARMGDDPTASVLDPHNQCWDAQGLYVTDGASFPSQGSQNPTLTIMALTARACDHALRSQGVAGLTGVGGGEPAPARG
jgi:choline dehydrogenase-like flavoprotein